jgi:hypothetical protein
LACAGYIVRYDGGNDEGFAWADCFEMQDGTRIDADTIGRRLYEMKVQDTLYDVGIMKRGSFRMLVPDGVSDQEMERLNDVAMDWLCYEWAAMLLGRSFGTGEYSMFGAFTVDLETCMIVDDPDADPVVKNIQIAN